MSNKQTKKKKIPQIQDERMDALLATVVTELEVTQSALDVHMKCTPFVKDW